MIAIITDSTCDIPQTILDQYGIIVVPHTIAWGDQQYRDRVDLTPETFYQRLETDTRRPTTSQASVMDFKQAIDMAVGRGATEVIILTVSSAMSGAYQMAQAATKLVNIDSAVIDSKGPSMTLGWQVLTAARTRDEGADRQAILKRVEQVRNRLVQLVGMNTLEYLQKGGRIGDAMKWIGTMLQVKPLVSINHQTGRVEPVGLMRTHKAMVELMYARFFDSLSSKKALRIAVLHGNCLEEAQGLAERIRAEFNPLELMVNITGPVLGINTGPGALALCGYPEG